MLTVSMSVRTSLERPCQKGKTASTRSLNEARFGVDLASYNVQPSLESKNAVQQTDEMQNCKNACALYMELSKSPPERWLKIFTQGLRNHRRSTRILEGLHIAKIDDSLQEAHPSLPLP